MSSRKGSATSSKGPSGDPSMQRRDPILGDLGRLTASPDEVSQTSSEDSSGDNSIAVDCTTGPAEVIVKGKNAKIRVKFPPRPPSSTKRKQSAFQHQISQSSYRNDDDLPFPQEETISSHALGSSAPADVNAQNAIAPLALPSDTMSTSSTRGPPAVSLQSLSSATLNEEDMRVKRDILNGVLYFERRNEELKELNNRLAAEMSRMKEANRQLKADLDRMSQRYRREQQENEELKIKLDHSEKENTRLQDQAVSQWHDRVHTEEQFTELRQSTNLEIQKLKEDLSLRDNDMKNLRQLLDKKEEEIRQLLKSVESLKSSIKDNGDYAEKQSQHHTAGVDINGQDSTDGNIELLMTIEQLQEKINRAAAERELRDSQNREQLKQIQKLKTHLQGKEHELEAQAKRFLSLKKSFKEIMDENDKLRQRRSRRNSFAGNLTWPKANKDQENGEKSSEADTLQYCRVVELPSVTTMTQRHKLSPPGFKSSPPRSPAPGVRKPRLQARHGRNKSEGHTLSDSLPPVTKK